MSTLSPVHTVVVRVWLPDRPGALGDVASQIGAAGGDVLGIDILEVGGGRVIDEIVVALPEAGLVDVMVEQVHAIDEVSVEHVRPTSDLPSDRGLQALSLTAELAETESHERLKALVDGVARLTEASWSIVVHGTDVVASFGDSPSADWINSLLAGSRHLGDPHAAAGDMFWADLPITGMWLAAGRPDRPVHEFERVRLDLFARTADALLAAGLVGIADI
jgi:hypothetical protein